MTTATDGPHPVPAKAAAYPQMVDANGLGLYVDSVGRGPDVLLIAALATPSSRGSSSSTGSRTGTG